MDSLKYGNEEIEKALNNDDYKMFEYLFRTLFPTLTNFAFKFVNDREIAKEQVQECFISVWNRRHEISFKNSVSSYFYTAVRNRCINFLKKEYHKPIEPLESLTESAGNNDNSNLEAEELSKLINTSIDSLNPKTRIIFQLSREEKLSYKEIAERMSVSVKTVEFHISAALRKIREDLENQWYLPIIVILNLFK